MTNEQLLDRVTIDSAVCHGQPCIRATRVLGHRRPLRLAAGMSAAQIVEHYPTADCRRRPRSRGLWSLVREAGDPRAVGDLVKIKLGENITASTRICRSAGGKRLLAAHGHECHTVPTRN